MRMNRNLRWVSVVMLAGLSGSAAVAGADDSLFGSPPLSTHEADAAVALPTAQQRVVFAAFARNATDADELPQALVRSIGQESLAARGLDASQARRVLPAFRGRAAIDGAWLVPGADRICLFVQPALGQGAEGAIASCASPDVAATRGIRSVGGGYGDLRGTDAVRVVSVDPVGGAVRASAVGSDGASTEIASLTDITGLR
jgi:hypothetical protein